MKIAMIGCGAAGSCFAGYLRKGGADITLVDRYEAHMDKIKKDGLEFIIYPDTHYHLDGFKTAYSADDIGVMDIVIFVTKATQLEAAVQSAMPCIGPDTVVCSLINGLGNDDNLLKFYPRSHCVIGSGVLGTALRGPGHCVSTPAGGVQMNFGGIECNERTDAVCAEMLKCYRDGGCDAYWRRDDIYKFIWKKVIVNSTVNTVCYVLRLKIGEVEAHPAGQKLFHDVIREACAVATARGTPLDADEFIAHDHYDIITNIGDYYPSMCQDAFNKRQTEIDVLNGKIAEYGKELGIPTPTCDVLSTIVRAIQDNYDKQF